MKQLITFALYIFIASCNSTEKTGEPEKTESQNSSPLNCYRYSIEFDTINLKLVRVGSSITGTLVYKLKEKDSNKGTIQGFMRENLLIADYTFWSEGVSSKRQVAFKLDGKTLIEGHGEMIEQNGRTVFKDIDSLNFAPTFALTEIPCQ